MLSYRHAFHVGNHADVLKHCVWVYIVNYLKKKDKPFYLHDTHAGAGLYQLSSEFVQKKNEYLDGISRVLSVKHSAAIINDYLDIVHHFNPETLKDIQTYPGSPAISHILMRAGDRMNITDLHGSELPELNTLFKGAKNVKIHKMDAYQGLASMLPPKEKRGAILIDPSYEVKDEYKTLPNSLTKALKSFSNGIYAIWYPVLKRSKTDQFVHDLKIRSEMKHKQFLRIELNVQADREEGTGMVGSGMFVVNPPYLLKENMQEALPELFSVLNQGEGKVLIEDNL